MCYTNRGLYDISHPAPDSSLFAKPFESDHDIIHPGESKELIYKAGNSRGIFSSVNAGIDKADD